MLSINNLLSFDPLILMLLFILFYFFLITIFRSFDNFFCSPVRRNVLGQRRSFWAVIENYERESTELFESVSNIKALPGIK